MCKRKGEPIKIRMQVTREKCKLPAGKVTTQGFENNQKRLFSQLAVFLCAF